MSELTGDTLTLDVERRLCKTTLALEERIAKLEGRIAKLEKAIVKVEEKILMLEGSFGG